MGHNPSQVLLTLLGRPLHTLLWYLFYESDFTGGILIWVHLFWLLVENKELSHFCQVQYSHRLLWNSPPQDADGNFAAGIRSKEIISQSNGGWFKYQRVSLRLTAFVMTLWICNTPLASFSPLFITFQIFLDIHINTIPAHCCFFYFFCHTLPLLANLSLHDASLPPSIRVFYCYRANTLSRQSH